MQDPKKLLRKIGKPNLKYLGKGMQSVVFEIDEKTVLKVYGKDMGLGNLTRLSNFYKTLNLKDVTFNTPYIEQIEEKQDHILVTERRLKGICPTKEYLIKTSEENIKKFLDSYLRTLFQLQKIECQFLKDFEPLETFGQFFEFKKYESWNELLLYNLSKKYMELIGIIPQEQKYLFTVKDQISDKITNIPQIEPSLIHGDFFPANTMVDNDYSINSVLDFGILTVKGDPIFDIALGWVFSDMYGEIKNFDIKSHLKPLILEKLTENEIERFHLYILVYSIISANMYSNNDPDDGHLKWCLHNLQNKSLLNGAGM